MTKVELIAQMSKKMQIPNNEAGTLVNTLFALMTDGMIADGGAEFRNFGVFKVKQRHARMGRNPKTGEPANIPARKTLTFKVSKQLKERLNEG